jgi:hypothetical protein
VATLEIIPAAEIAISAAIIASDSLASDAVGKTISAMKTLPSLSWLGHKLMPEVLAFSAKALFDCANTLVLAVMTLLADHR